MVSPPFHTAPLVGEGGERCVALYLLGTFLLGSPLDHWQQDARMGLAAFLVGVLVLGISLWLAFREHVFEWFRKGRKASSQPVSPLSSTTGVPALQTIIPGEVNKILEALLAGTITREEASARILSLTGERIHTGETSGVGVRPVTASGDSHR